MIYVRYLTVKSDPPVLTLELEQMAKPGLLLARIEGLSLAEFHLSQAANLQAGLNCYVLWRRASSAHLARKVFSAARCGLDQPVRLSGGSSSAINRISSSATFAATAA